MSTDKAQIAKKRQTIGLVPLPQEMIVSLSVNDLFMAKMSCSPFELKEFAIGWLFTQGIIEHVDEIKRLAIADTSPKLRVWLTQPFPERFASLSPGQSSSCGGGSFNTRLFGNLTALKRTYDLELPDLKGLSKTMIEREHMYKVHGGVHCTMLANSRDGNILVTMEDIGRNNAIDKVIGWGLQKNIDFSSLILLVTGRISSDMILKAYRAKISTMVSLTTATSLAFEIVQKTNQTLVCHVLKPRPIIINF